MVSVRFPEPEGGDELSPFEQARLEREYAELENERWERVDRRVQRYVMLGLIVIGAVSAIVMAFLTLNSSDPAIRISPGAGVTVSIVAGLRLRALSGGETTSIWDWLLQRDGKSAD
jgi:hypothetical protein